MWWSVRDTGVALSPEKRARMKAILQRLEEIRQEFDRNVRDNKTRLAFRRKKQRACRRPTWRARGATTGQLSTRIRVSRVRAFMANAENEERGAAITSLQQPGHAPEPGAARRDGPLAARDSGLVRAAELRAFRRSPANGREAETVHRFLDEVKDRVRELERKEIGELRALKAERSGKSVQEVAFSRWDVPYYQEQLKKTRYNVDQEALRAYFPTEASVAWCSRFRARSTGQVRSGNSAALAPSVRYYDVIDGGTGAFLSGIYLDLFPREGKYSHAAAFGVRSASVLASARLSACWWRTSSKGLDHRELETLLHEFGHILHGVCRGRAMPVTAAPMSSAISWKRRRRCTKSGGARSRCGCCAGIAGDAQRSMTR